MIIVACPCSQPGKVTQPHASPAKTPKSGTRRSPGVPPTTSVTLNFNPQIISAVESTIIQNVRGTMHLGPQAKELLAAIERYGGQETVGLKSAVHELEDTEVPSAVRSAAKRRLKKFLGQLAGTVHDVAIDLLEKYLESKIG
jgi:hypothetical protein